MSKWVPSDENWPVTYSRAPSPKVVRITTDATPMAIAIPMRKVREREAVEARMPNRSMSSNFIIFV
jgi:hypothetical protein